MTRDHAVIACKQGIFCKYRLATDSGPASQVGKKIIQVNGRTAVFHAGSKAVEVAFDAIEVDWGRNRDAGIPVPPSLEPVEDVGRRIVILQASACEGYCGPNGWSDEPAKWYQFDRRSRAESEAHRLKANGIKDLEVLSLDTAVKRLEELLEAATAPSPEIRQRREEQRTIETAAAELSDVFDLPTSVLSEILNVTKERDRIHREIASERDLRAKREQERVQAARDVEKCDERIGRLEQELSSLKTRIVGLKHSLVAAG